MAVMPRFCSQLIALLLILHGGHAAGQTLNKIRQASDNHSSPSGSGASSSSSRSASGSNSEGNTYYEESYEESYADDGEDLEVVFDLLFNAMASGRSREEKLRDRAYRDSLRWERSRSDAYTPKFKSSDLIIRRAIDNRKVLITNFQYNHYINNFFFSMRYNFLTESRAAEDDRFETWEYQFIGFNTKTKPLSFAMATGILYEAYSGNLYNEHLAILRYERVPGVSFYAEGRLAMNQGVAVRTEGTLEAWVTLKKWEVSALNLGAFFTSALYYRTVPVENVGMSVQVRF